MADYSRPAHPILENTVADTDGFIKRHPEFVQIAQEPPKVNTVAG